MNDTSSGRDRTTTTGGAPQHRRAPAAVSIVGAESPAAAATPVEDMGCRMVVFDNLWEHPYSRDGMVDKVSRVQGPDGLIQEGVPRDEGPPVAAQRPPRAFECTVGARHLSGVTRTHYKGIRVVVFKYRLDYLRSC